MRDVEPKELDPNDEGISARNKYGVTVEEYYRRLVRDLDEWQEEKAKRNGRLVIVKKFKALSTREKAMETFGKIVRQVPDDKTQMTGEVRLRVVYDEAPIKNKNGKPGK